MSVLSEISSAGGDPLREVYSVTAIGLGTAFPAGACKCVIAGGAGSLNYTDLAGNVVVGFPIQAGFNPIRATKISAGGTATDLWIGY